MEFTLSRSVKVGNKILTSFGWRTVKEVTDDGVLTKEGLTKFGAKVLGWKSK